jgi:hypothetical protein
MVKTPLDSEAVVDSRSTYELSAAEPVVRELRSDFLRQVLVVKLALGLGLLAAIVLSPEVGLVVAGLGGMSSPMLLYLADDLMTASPEERWARVQVLVMTICSVLVGYLTAADGWPFAATWLASLVVSWLVWAGMRRVVPV